MDGSSTGRPWPSMDGAVDLGTYQRAIMSREEPESSTARLWPSDGWKRHGLPTCHHVERGRNQKAARPVRGILHGWSRRYRPPTNIYCKIARLGRGKFRIILRITWNILRLFQDARPVRGILRGWSCRSWNLPTCHHAKIGGGTRKQHGPSVIIEKSIFLKISCIFAQQNVICCTKRLYLPKISHFSPFPIFFAIV